MAQADTGVPIADLCRKNGMSTASFYAWKKKYNGLTARDYDPEVGRSTAKDPIGFEGRSQNLYAYVGGDAVNVSDPEGLIPMGPPPNGPPPRDPHPREAECTKKIRSGLGVAVLARPLAELYPELEAIEGLPPIPEIPVWLVGHRALRNLPRIKAVWAFLEELASALA